MISIDETGFSSGSYNQFCWQFDPDYKRMNKQTTAIPGRIDKRLLPAIIDNRLLFKKVQEGVKGEEEGVKEAEERNEETSAMRRE